MRRSSIPRRQHEQILAAAHLRHQQELDQAKALLAESEARLQAVSADRERLRGEREQFEKDRDTYRTAAARLERELSAPAMGPEDTAGLQRRIKHLEKQLDDAVGLPAGRIEDSGRWQPGHQAAKKDTV
jgi:chromosome segregation ATPase